MSDVTQVVERLKINILNCVVSHDPVCIFKNTQQLFSLNLDCYVVNVITIAVGIFNDHQF